MKILVCQYSHIEGYPPTFNAINVMASEGHQVMVLMRKDMITTWDYNKNIQITTVGNYKNRFEFEKTSKWNKIKEFINYLLQMIKLIRKTKLDIVLLYDNIPLMAFSIIRILLFKKIKVWYHNHDSNILGDYKKFSLNYFAYFFEKRAFRFIDIFTLPQKERLRLFNLKKFKGKNYIIPNFPPKYLFNNKKKEIHDYEQIKLLYPGNINENIGIENVIPILGKKIADKSICLKLVGDVRDRVKEKFILLAKKNNVENYISFETRQSYLNMPGFISNYHIGLAMYKPVNLSNAEAGTAANKIYEYAACGLPVILNDTEHYRKHLEKYKWAFFFDAKKDSLIKIIEKITKNYKKISEQSKTDFETDLYFEKYFIPILNKIIEQN